ncbi:MAG: lamin tail domain-containing protein, partial [Candidatus Paceibacteria bacterium]
MNGVSKVKIFLIFFACNIFLLLGYNAYAAIRINEIMYDLPGPDKTETGLGREWVELFNAGTEPVTLVGGSEPGSWRFIDSQGPHLLAKEALQGSMTIPAGGYAILAADAKTFIDEHPNFKGTVIDTVMNLKNNQDLIKIRDGQGNIVDETYWSSNLGAAGNGRTLEFANGIWREGLRAGGSPGLENSIENVLLPEAPSPIPPPASPFPSPSTSPKTSVETQSNVLKQKVSGAQLPVLVVNEFMPNPKGNDAEGEWIELKNTGADRINLLNWQLDDIEGGSQP